MSFRLSIQMTHTVNDLLDLPLESIRPFKKSIYGYTDPTRPHTNSVIVSSFLHILVHCFLVKGKGSPGSLKYG